MLPGDTSPNKFIAPPYNASTKREVKMPCPFSSEAYSDGPQAASIVVPLCNTE